MKLVTADSKDVIKQGAVVVGTLSRNEVPTKDVELTPYTQNLVAGKAIRALLDEGSMEIGDIVYYEGYYTTCVGLICRENDADPIDESKLRVCLRKAAYLFKKLGIEEFVIYYDDDEDAWADMLVALGNAFTSRMTVVACRAPQPITRNKPPW